MKTFEELEANCNVMKILTIRTSQDKVDAAVE